MIVYSKRLEYKQIQEESAVQISEKQLYLGWNLGGQSGGGFGCP